MTKKFVRVKRCVDCEFFDYGMNDPQCYHPDKPDRLYPNSGAYADRKPPAACPLRREPYTTTYYVAYKDIYEEDL